MLSRSGDSHQRLADEPMAALLARSPLLHGLPARRGRDSAPEAAAFNQAA